MSEAYTEGANLPSELKGRPVQQEVYIALLEGGEEMKRSEIAGAAEVDPDNVSQALRGLRSDDLVEKVGHGYYDLPERVGNQDEGEMGGHEVQASSNGPETLPLLNADAHASETGAAWEIEVESYMSVDRDILRAQSGGNPDQMAIMTVTGNSMEDTIDAGDQIIIVRHREGDRILQGSVYVWLNAQRGVLIKRAIWQDDGSLTLRPDNDDCPEIHITDIEAPDWSPIGRVFRVMRAV